MTAALTFIVEGKTDAELLRALLSKRGAAKTPLRFFAAQGKLLLASLARNVAVELGGPLMVVGDTDESPTGNANAFRRELTDALAPLTPPGTFDVFAFSPNLDAVIAEATGQTGVLPTSISKTQLLLSKLDSTPAQELCAHPQLDQFLRSVATLRNILPSELPLAAKTAHRKTAARR